MNYLDFSGIFKNILCRIITGIMHPAGIYFGLYTGNSFTNSIKQEFNFVFAKFKVMIMIHHLYTVLFQ